AADYVSKNDLTRLVPAVKRVMTDPSAVAASLAIREELATQVSFALTGLLKREAFCEHLNHLLRSRSEQDAVTTVILFNIERLRDINETHGRHVGDQLLRCIAERLRRRFGEGDNLAYFGGGIFVAVFNE